MSGKRPVDVMVRNRYGYAQGGYTLLGTYGTRETGIKGAIKRLAEFAKKRPGGAALAYDSIAIVRAPGHPWAYVGYPMPTGLNSRGTDTWSPRECQDAVLDGTLRPMRLSPVGDPYVPENWVPWDGTEVESRHRTVEVPTVEVVQEPVDLARRLADHLRDVVAPAHPAAPVDPEHFSRLHARAFGPFRAESCYLYVGAEFDSDDEVEIGVAGSNRWLNRHDARNLRDHLTRLLGDA